ncbi:hypothetical protein F6B42_02835 [Microbacterium radiodurans]|uniref:Uncharacterized protein n=1 Tax=Microbacterium radiodurans TaxID=661398 RepID=A0A5J5IU99_9MICO|nr:hypothetical protein F6B42_02835 [Microbacterium radiodurans]
MPWIAARGGGRTGRWSDGAVVGRGGGRTGRWSDGAVVRQRGGAAAARRGTARFGVGSRSEPVDRMPRRLCRDARFSTRHAGSPASAAACRLRSLASRHAPRTRQARATHAPGATPGGAGQISDSSRSFAATSSLLGSTWWVASG